MTNPNQTNKIDKRKLARRKVVKVERKTSFPVIFMRVMIFIVLFAMIMGLIVSVL